MNMNKINLNEDWYKKAQMFDSLRKEAGLKDVFKNIPLWLSFALVAILSGSAIENTVKQYNLSEQQRIQLEETMKNKELMNKIHDTYQNIQIDYQPEVKANPVSSPHIEQNQQNQQNQQNEQRDLPKSRPVGQPVKLNTIVAHMLKHENLLPHQTPFRITNKEMRRWNKIMGFPVNKQPNAPPNRKNFIFLKNHQDVVPAVTKLLENYANDPGRYGLPNNPTLRQAIKKFDQTNSIYKIKFLKEEIPHLNIDKPLKDFL